MSDPYVKEANTSLSGMRPTSDIHITTDSADLFYLAKLVKRDLVKARRNYEKPSQVERRAELAEQGKGDLAKLMIEKHARLHEQLKTKAMALRACEITAEREAQPTTTTEGARSE